MKPLGLDYASAVSFLGETELERELALQRSRLEEIRRPSPNGGADLGWLEFDSVADAALLGTIKEKAEAIRENADIFILIGVGGSNQGARAVIEALGDNSKIDSGQRKGPKIIYAGNNLSPKYLNSILEEIQGKSVYVNVIAKNFATLEPGISFRIFRQYLERTYGKDGAAQRIIATGSLNRSSLEVLGENRGYTLLPFPLNVGGRFSVLTAVGLLPIAVSGVEIDQLLAGAREMKDLLQRIDLENSPAVIYALLRNLLLKKGYEIEVLAHFEPVLEYFAKWWLQLFGESEGKEGKGVYPSRCSYSEDLHAIGQYLQQGRRVIFETFINLEKVDSSLILGPEPDDCDQFNYLSGYDLGEINRIAYRATYQAHTEGGVPCIGINVPRLNAYYFGQLFFFFEMACYLSATLLGVNPFDQPGVEAYKKNMFELFKSK